MDERAAQAKAAGHLAAIAAHKRRLRRARRALIREREELNKLRALCARYGIELLLESIPPNPPPKSGGSQSGRPAAE